MPKQLEPTECHQYRTAMPSGGFTRVAEMSGEKYSLVIRTMNGLVRKWDQRHHAIAKATKELFKKRGITINR